MTGTGEYKDLVGNMRQDLRGYPQSVVDYWEQRAEKAEAENAKLCAVVDAVRDYGKVAGAGKRIQDALDALDKK